MATSAFAVILLTASLGKARDLRIGVFGLFHPARLVVSSLPAQTAIITADAHHLVLADGREAILDVEGNQIHVRVDDEVVRASAASVADWWGRSTGFLVTFPGKITRRYRGKLEVKSRLQELVAVVEMDLETAVASAVAAESVPEAPLEALKAQAIASRSYYLGSRLRHREFDFCDTTHCQFLREVPPADSLAAQATAVTRGLVLSYEGAIVPALFTGSCGGRTRTLAEVGLGPSPYPYFSVPCNYCLRHAPHWSRRLGPREAANLARHSEAKRLRLGRIRGWNAVPGNHYELQGVDDVVVVEGTGKGHGVGLCQLGAAGLAKQGCGFQEILAHYYPNTVLETR